MDARRNHKDGGAMTIGWQAHYESLAEFAALEPSSAHNREVLTKTLADGRERWLGVEGGSSAVQRIFTEGWPEGVTRTLEALKGLQVRRATSIRRKRIRADFGDAIDMQRVYRGDLANAW